MRTSGCLEVMLHPYLTGSRRRCKGALESGSMPITWSASEAGLQVICPSCGQSLALHAALVSEPRPATTSRSSQTTGCASWFVNWWQGEATAAAPSATGGPLPPSTSGGSRHKAPVIFYGARFPGSGCRFEYGSDALFGRVWGEGAPASGSSGSARALEPVEEEQAAPRNT